MFNYLIWILIIILYSPVFYSLYQFRWEKLDYTHAYFILPISLWLTWRKRRQLVELFSEGSNNFGFVSFAILLIGLLMFFFGWREDYLFITALSLIPVLCGTIIYLYGIKTVRALSFPLFYLLLLVPPPMGVLDSVTLPMRHGISDEKEKILLLLD
ncbi:MAG: archaeosortase/exosortase family protein, partial [Planctomycetes bacterium]|nr:archaeosortase/exosortase family protein [Planctomycetota bacterium]